MIIPVRCFSCGKTIGDKYDYYLKESEALRKAQESEAAAAAAEAGATTSGGAPKKAAAAAAAAKPGTSAAAAAKPAAIPGASLKGAEKHFETLKTGALLDSLGLTRYCCRRHMLTTVDMMDVI
jgi:DNA-directed RNA polymerase subunit N (RpoN/RPB10)